MSSLFWHGSIGKWKTKHTHMQEYTIGLTPLNSNDNTLTTNFDSYSYWELHLATRATAVSCLAKFVRRCRVGLDIFGKYSAGYNSKHTLKDCLTLRLVHTILQSYIQPIQKGGELEQQRDCRVCSRCGWWRISFVSRAAKSCSSQSGLTQNLIKLLHAKL